MNAIEAKSMIELNKKIVLYSKGVYLDSHFDLMSSIIIILKWNFFLQSTEVGLYVLLGCGLIKATKKKLDFIVHLHDIDTSLPYFFLVFFSSSNQITFYKVFHSIF